MARINQPNHELTRDDMSEITPRHMPKGSFRGELHQADGSHFAHIFVVNRRVIIADPDGAGRGFVNRALLDSYPSSDFERAGQLRLSAAQTVKFWKFKGAPKQESTKPEPWFPGRPELLPKSTR